MLKITLKDGAVREVAEGASVLDFVKQVSNSLAKKVLAAKVDGKTVDLTYVLDRDCQVDFLSFLHACSVYFSKGDLKKQEKHLDSSESGSYNCSYT